MFSISRTSRRKGGASLRKASIFTFLIQFLWSDPLWAQAPQQNGWFLPVDLWFIGAGVLGIAIAYGILRNRGRTRRQAQLTEQATRDNYAEEERRASSSSRL